MLTYPQNRGRENPSRLAISSQPGISGWGRSSSLPTSCTSSSPSPHPLPQSGAESLQWGGRRCHPSAPSTWMWLAPPLELLLHHLPLHPLTGPGSATPTMTKRMSRALQWLGTHPWSWLRPTSHLLMDRLLLQGHVEASLISYNFLMLVIF